MEKNEVINMEMKGVRKDAESKLVKVNKSLTLNTVMANTKKKMGRKFLPYSAYNNNCQDFLMAILKSNKLGNQTVYKFVKQYNRIIPHTSLKGGLPIEVFKGTFDHESYTVSCGRPV